MPKAKRLKSIREAMSEVGRAADTKLDAISKSVKKHEKDIADIKTMVKDIKKALAKIGGPATKGTPSKKSTPAKKTNAGKKNVPKKKAAPKKHKKPVKNRKKSSASSVFPF